MPFYHFIVFGIVGVCRGVLEIFEKRKCLLETFAIENVQTDAVSSSGAAHPPSLPPFYPPSLSHQRGREGGTMWGRRTPGRRRRGPSFPLSLLSHRHAGRTPGRRWRGRRPGRRRRRRPRRGRGAWRGCRALHYFIIIMIMIIIIIIYLLYSLGEEGPRRGRGARRGWEEDRGAPARFVL